jgi:Arc/MetJ-type ribon-helix-helix transcriptional regulator
MNTGDALKTESPQKAVRTTISLPPKVAQWGEEIRRDDGFTSLSDLIEYMIRIRKGQHCG